MPVRNSCLGLHSRIDETIADVCQTAKVGNIYVNRNMVVAVVGVQPFGGEGLSGTGPKAGGPLYLYRLLSQRPATIMDKLFTPPDNRYPVKHGQPSLQPLTPFAAFCDWVKNLHHATVAAVIDLYQPLTATGICHQLPGPTGEHNSYRLVPRGRILCLAETEADAVIQLAAVLAMGCQVLWPNNAIQQQLQAELPALVNQMIS